MNQYTEGQVVSFGDSKKNWIVLRIAQEHIDKGTVKVANPGWYLFSGLALGQNPMEPAHYSECQSVEDFQGESIHSHGDAHAFPATMLHMLLKGG